MTGRSPNNKVVGPKINTPTKRLKIPSPKEKTKLMSTKIPPKGVMSSVRPSFRILRGKSLCIYRFMVREFPAQNQAE